jgi:hypothetical protein
MEINQFGLSPPNWGERLARRALPSPASPRIGGRGADNQTMNTKEQTK